MKKLSTYLPSLIMSVFLVFCIIGAGTAVLADVCLTSEKTVSFAQEENIDDRAYASIEKYYREKAAATGIPATVFTDNISLKYVRRVMKVNIKETFSALENGGKFSPDIPENPALEEAIDRFFNDYADKTGYVKDEKFEKKLESTKKSAYKTIGDGCDIFKVNSMNSHGLLKKLSRIYRKRYVLTAVLFSALFILISALLIVNRKNKRVLLYWCGLSSLIAGIIGIIPSAYLISTKYYDSFAIKQPQVFRAYTRALYRLTEHFLVMSVVFAAVGAVMLAVYFIVSGRGKTDAAKETKSAESGKDSSDEKNKPEILTDCE
ncbi:MAG: hypothetical protein IKO47_01720 [Ruminococcus sp.]|nr:hypothetical protein [Ruminococcus sp.]